MKRWDGILLEDMDDSAIDWCLRQDWIDPYLRKGFERVIEKRYPPRTPPTQVLVAAGDDVDDEDDGLPF